MYRYQILKLEPTSYAVVVRQEDKDGVILYGFLSRDNQYTDLEIKSDKELSKNVLTAIAQGLENAYKHGYNLAIKDIQMLMTR